MMFFFNVHYNLFMENYLPFLFGGHGGGAVGSSVRLASGNLGVRIPAAKDLSRKKQAVSAQLLNTQE